MLPADHLSLRYRGGLRGEGTEVAKGFGSGISGIYLYRRMWYWLQ